MMDISSLSFEEIKKIIKNENLSEECILEVTELFKLDKRKNVKLLGEKLLRSLEKQKVEGNRIRAMYDFDRSFGSFNYVAGVDEVGRGPFAGPIVAAAVILDLNNIRSKNLIAGIKDSKALSPGVREVIAKK